MSARVNLDLSHKRSPDKVLPSLGWDGHFQGFADDLIYFIQLEAVIDI